MTDIFAIRSERQRQVVVGALLVYAALFVVELTVDSADFAGPASDLVVAALVLGAAVVGTRRATEAADTSVVTLVTVAALVMAGLSIGYEGLAGFDVVPSQPAISTVGSLALFLVLGLYLYENYV